MVAAAGEATPPPDHPSSRVSVCSSSSSSQRHYALSSRFRELVSPRRHAWVSLRMRAAAAWGHLAEDHRVEKRHTPEIKSYDRVSSTTNQRSTEYLGVNSWASPLAWPSASSMTPVRKIGLLAGGDLLCFLIFYAVGRLSHGLPVLDAKTADPFVAGWLLGAYLLAGFGDDAKGSNGVDKAVIVAAKSWAVGISDEVLQWQDELPARAICQV